MTHVLDGKTYKEIAQKYNIAKGTVAYTMQREASQYTEVASNWEETPQDDREIQAMVGQGD